MKYTVGMRKNGVKKPCWATTVPRWKVLAIRNVLLSLGRRRNRQWQLTFGIWDRLTWRKQERREAILTEVSSRSLITLMKIEELRWVW